MTVQENLILIYKSLKNLEKTGIYDVEKYSRSLLHQTNRLEYFFCHIVNDVGRNADNTYYRIAVRPKEHQLAYFNIGRGFPKELMDGHWCYILKDMGCKMLVIPCTSIKGTLCNLEFEMDIKIKMNNKLSMSRLQLSDLRTIDIQRLDLRKDFCKVITSKKRIKNFVKSRLF